MTHILGFLTPLLRICPWILSGCITLCSHAFNLSQVLYVLSLLSFLSLFPVEGVRFSWCDPLPVGAGHRSVPLLQSSRSPSFTTRSRKTDRQHRSPPQFFLVPYYTTPPSLCWNFVMFFSVFSSLLSFCTYGLQLLFYLPVGSDVVWSGFTLQIGCFIWHLQTYQILPATFCENYIWSSHLWTYYRGQRIELVWSQRQSLAYWPKEEEKNHISACFDHLGLCRRTLPYGSSLVTGGLPLKPEKLLPQVAVE